MLYAKYEYVKELERELCVLERTVERGCPKRVFRRKREKGFSYYEITVQNGRRIQRTINDQWLGMKYYSQYAQYRIAEIRLAQVRQELGHLKMDSEMLRQQLMEEYEQIKTFQGGLQVPQNFRTEGLLYETLRGEKVRSKSEAIIADALYRHGIFYQYEKILEADGVTRVDFTMEHNIRGCTLYWEHFGKMDDPDYVLEYLKKKKRYESMGIAEGKNLIATYEFYGSGKPALPFDARQAEAVVLQYFEVLPGGVK